MRFKEFLNETPLPDDWDKQVYTGRTSYAKQIKYAMERAKKLGGGSSRVAFDIEYQGRNTALKIAKNQKGLAQNEAEVDLLSDWYLKGLEITIPMIDYDEENSMPRWIHTEKAEKITMSQFKKVTGGLSFEELVVHALGFHGRGRSKYHSPEMSEKVDEENEFIHNFIEFVGNYTHVPMGDFMRKANWGMFKGSPVIIDMGLSSEVQAQYYS